MFKHVTSVALASLAVAAAIAAGPAMAADLLVKAAPPPAVAPSMFDIAFGAAIMSDYNFRGVSQSDRGMAASAYFEPRFKISPNFEIYAGIAGYSTKLPTSPTGEFDGYGGVRATFGPVTFDVGGIYYYYPRERQQFLDAPVPATTIVSTTPTAFPLTVADTDYAEVYGKVTWTANDMLTFGGYVYYSDNVLNSGAYGLYFGGTAKITAPTNWFPTDWGSYLSGEVAYYDLGTTGPVLGAVNLPNYTYWNIGVAFTYKAFTLDLRYHDTDLSRASCFNLTGDPRGALNGGFSRWCGETFIAKLSVDTTLSALK